jgi:hypothetical protein
MDGPYPSAKLAIVAATFELHCPQRFVPSACHIEGSIPVASGQPRSIALDHKLAVPRSTSLNASREYA